MACREVRIGKKIGVFKIGFSSPFSPDSFSSFGVLARFKRGNNKIPIPVAIFTAVLTIQTSSEVKVERCTDE